ncbi:MAG: HutD family protein [Bacteroidota bacterium]
MNFEIIKASNTKTTTWSGGTTSEIYIFPKGSDFQKRDFLFRLSVATVELEESTFTSLPEVNRTLMVLKGNLHLKHEGQHESHLNEFQQDSFKGEWTTKSVGKVTDFNLMCKGDTTGELKHIHLVKSQEFELSATKELFYVIEGEFTFEGERLEKGDLLIFENKKQKIELFSKNADLIWIRIN